MELKKIIEQTNKDLEELNELVKKIDEKRDLLNKYGITVEFKSV